MKQIKVGLIAILIAAVLIAIYYTLILKQNKEQQVVVPEPVIEKSEEEKEIGRLENLLPENEKTEEEKQEDLNLLEKGQENTSEPTPSNINQNDAVLNLLELNQESEEDKKKKALLDSLSE